MSNEIRRELTKRAEKHSLRLADISITTLTFGDEFSKAIEQKQVAEQMCVDTGGADASLYSPPRFSSLHTVPRPRKLCQFLL